MSIVQVIRSHAFNLMDIEDLSYEDHLKIFRFFMKELGFDWISNERPTIIQYILCFMTSFLILYFLVSELIFIKHNLDDMAKTTECLMTFFLGCAICIKLLLMFFNRNKLKVIIVEMSGAYENFKSVGGVEWDIMFRRIKEARIITRIFLYICV